MLRFHSQIQKTTIPMSWIMDTVTDCINGQDENSSLWRVCPGNIISPARSPCINAFICPGFEITSAVFLEHLCDGYESCGDEIENVLCKIARDFPSINKTTDISSDLIRNVCNSGVCVRKEFIRPWGSVFGETPIKLYVPKMKVNCTELFGEYYLYLSCMGLCLEANVSCPLNNGNRKLQYDSCPGQYPDRAYTLGNNSFLTFVNKSHSGFYHQNFYQCNNSKCIEYKQVCDLVDDCGDMSDEIDCANNMICEHTKISIRHQIISLSQKCDGIYDCFDLSDECNESCVRHVLEHWLLKTVCWSMGILALTFNFQTLKHGLSSFRKCQSDSMLVSKVLISLIGFGDFLIGLYLLILSIYDSIIFRESYCKNQPEWLTGTPCLVLGVISTVGSQVSLFSMTAFSCIRMYGLGFKRMRIPAPVNKKAVGRIIILVSAILISSLAVALIPLVPSLEDYFIQGMYYDPAYKIFIGFPNKNRHIDVLKAYYNTTNYSSTITSDMSWKEIGEKVDSMFTQNYGSLFRKPVHFYGNDGVCLFKYFVRTDDARRSRQTLESGTKTVDLAVWTMLIVNLLCFIVIVVCYVKIVLNTRKSTSESGQHDNPDRLKENKTLEKRIMIIIATDFMCWVPFICVSILHNIGKIDATSWYVYLAMIALPLNSVINPLIYDKVLLADIKQKFKSLMVVIKRIFSLAVSKCTEIFRNQNFEPEVIPMGPVDPIESC